MEFCLQFITLLEATQLRAANKESNSLVAAHPWDEHHLTTEPDLYFKCFPEALTIFSKPAAGFRVPPTVKHLAFTHSEVFNLPILSLHSFSAIFCQVNHCVMLEGLHRLNLTCSYFDPLFLIGFKSVKELVISGCEHVRPFHLCGFPNCEKLVARNCTLSDAFLPHMPLLKILDLQHVIGKFDHYPLPLLEELSTPLCGAPPLDFPRLKKLYCTFGTTIALEHKTLQHLVVDGSSIDVFKLPQLQTLTLRYANVEPLRDLSRLQKLTISYCVFEDAACLCNLDVAELVVDHCDLRGGALTVIRRIQKICVLCCEVAALPPCADLTTCACVAVTLGLTAGESVVWECVH